MKIKSFLLSLIIILIILFPVYGQQDSISKYSYLDNFEFKDTTSFKLIGPARIIERDGRQGLNLTSILYNAGHIAIRCMLHSKILFRNLKLYNSSQFSEIKKIN